MACGNPLSVRRGKFVCPACGKTVAFPVKLCSCGHQFEPEVQEQLQVYFELKSQLKSLKTVGTNLTENLNQMDHKMEWLEESLAKLFGMEGQVESKPNAEINAEYKTEQAKEQLSPEAVKPVQVKPESAKPELVGQEPLKPELVKPVPVKPETISRPSPKPYPPVKPKVSASSKNVIPEEFSLEMFLGLKGLLVIGIVAVIVGTAFFIKYSFDNNWVGPAGRVTMAYLFAAAILGSGKFFHQKKYDILGLYLIGGGVAMLYASTWGSFQIYHLFPQALAFCLMILVTIFAVTLSIIFDTRWLSILALVGGFSTPMLLSTGVDNQAVLMSYMVMLNLGMIGVAMKKRWNLLNTLCFIFTYVIFTGWYDKYYDDSKFVLTFVFLNLFFLIHAARPFISELMSAESPKGECYSVLLMNSFIAFGFNYSMIKNLYGLEWVSLISVAYAAIFLFMAAELHSRAVSESFYFLVGNAALFLIITVPILFSGHWITVFWMIQAVILLYIGLQVNRGMLANSGFILLILTLCKFLFYDYSEVFNYSFNRFAVDGGFDTQLIERLITIVFILGGTYIFAYLCREGSSVLTKQSLQTLNYYPELFTLWGILLFIVLNLETSAFFYDYLPKARLASISVLWTVFSISLILIGFRKDNSAIRKASLILFLLTILKVFLIDISQISAPYHIVSFIVLGLILIGASYLYNIYKQPMLDALKGSNSKER